MRIFSCAGGESIFIISVSAGSYATSGASDLYVKPKGPGGDVVCSFGDNSQQNNSIVWVQNYRAGLPEKKQAKAIVFRENPQ